MAARSKAYLMRLWFKLWSSQAFYEHKGIGFNFELLQTLVCDFTRIVPQMMNSKIDLEKNYLTIYLCVTYSEYYNTL